jgi:hypothetical protein
MVRSMKEVRQSTRIRMRWKIDELITIRVSSIIKVLLLNSLVTEAKLIQVTSTATKHANKASALGLGISFLTSLLGMKDDFGLHG